MRKILLGVAVLLLVPASAQARYLHVADAQRALIAEHAQAQSDGYESGMQVTHLVRDSGHSLYAYVHILGVPISLDDAPALGTLSVVEHLVLRGGRLRARTSGYTGVYTVRL